MKGFKKGDAVIVDPKLKLGDTISLPNYISSEGSRNIEIYKGLNEVIGKHAIISKDSQDDQLDAWVYLDDKGGKCYEGRWPVSVLLKVERNIGLLKVL